jgi:hypothetical protein
MGNSRTGYVTKALSPSPQGPLRGNEAGYRDKDIEILHSARLTALHHSLLQRGEGSSLASVSTPLRSE